MTALRTPDDRFTGLDDFPYDPVYTEIARITGPCASPMWTWAQATRVLST